MLLKTVKTHKSNVILAFEINDSKVKYLFLVMSICKI
jgi:hypothetical protein